MLLTMRLALFVLGAVPATIHDPEPIDVSIPSQGATLAGTLLLPDDEPGGKPPCVVLAGGSLSHTRDGGLIDPQGRAVPRDAIKRLADKLAVGGYASLRWDMRGRGKTPPWESTPCRT